MRIRFIIIVCFLCGRIFAQTSINNFPKKLLRGQFKNGLSYYIQPNKKPLNTTVFYLVVKTGSLEESDQQRGYAHFLEHMAFKGGRRFTKKSFVAQLAEKGYQIGRHYNAQTNYDHTIYTLEFPQKVTPALEKKVFLFFADILDGLFLSPAQIAVEKKIILEEKRVATPLDDHYNFKLGESLYKKRNAIGTNQSIQTVTNKRLRAFYERYYTPSKTAIFVVGALENPSKTKKIAQQILSGIPVKKDRLKKHSKKMYPYLKSAVKIKRIKNKTTSKMYLHWAFPHRLINSFDDVKNRATQKLLHKILVQRLDTLLHSDAKYIGMRGRFFVGQTRYHTLSLETGRPLKKTLQKILTALKNIAINGIPLKELQYHIKSLQTNYLLNTSPEQNTTALAYRYVDDFLGEARYVHPLKKDSIFRKGYQKIKNEDLKNYAENIWKAPLRIFAQVPLKKRDTLTLQQMQKIKDSIHKISQQPFAIDYFSDEKDNPIKNEPSIEKLKLPPLKKIAPIFRKKFTKTGIVHLKYPNGIGVWLKPIKNKSKQIRLLGYAPGGLSQVADSMYHRFESTVAYMELGGVANLDDEALQRYLDDKEIGMTFGIGEYERNIFSIFSSDKTQAYFRYLYAKMTAARKNTAMFQKIIAENVADADHKTNDFPSMPLMEAIHRLKNAYFPKRQAATTKADFQSLDLQEMARFYDWAFKNAKGWQFVVVGDFTAPKMEMMLGTYLANIPSDKRPLKNRVLFDEVIFLPIQKITAPLKKKTASTHLIFYGDYLPNMKNDIVLALLEKRISDAVSQKLREENGLVYTPWVSLEKMMYPAPYFTIHISYDCDEKKVKKAKKIVIETLRNILKNPLQAKNLEQYKKSVLLKFNETFSDNSLYDWAFVLLEKMSGRLTPQDLEGFEKQLKEVSPAILQQFIQKYLDLQRVKELVQYPTKINKTDFKIK